MQYSDSPFRGLVGGQQTLLSECYIDNLSDVDVSDRLSKHIVQFMNNIELTDKPKGFEALLQMIKRNPGLVVITGAGVSTESGIPAYRDADGLWQRSDPIQHQDFIRHYHVRQRYWARSLVGWPLMGNAEPNRAHHALARLEASGYIDLLVTQNVDRLHQRAGSRNVLDLHGRIDQVVCLSCGEKQYRSHLQGTLEKENPFMTGYLAGILPDGDAQVEGIDIGKISVPDCSSCGGMLKPDVVFFGDSVPRNKVEQVSMAIHKAQAVLVVGSSLMVFSGFRFCKLAAELGKPLAVINNGKTRADTILNYKLEGDCGIQLEKLSSALG